MLYAALLGTLLAAPAPGTVAEALKEINAHRSTYGLPALKLDPLLCKAAASHAAYLAVHKLVTHDQQPGKKGFTGKDSLTRARAAGFKGNVLEDVSFGNPQIPALRKVLSGPYHRRPLLQPDISSVGIGVSGNVTVMDFPVQSGTVVYPTPNQVVAASWDGHDWPSPYRMHRGAKPPFGPPIQVFLQNVGPFMVYRFDLVGPGGEKVACFMNMRSNDDMLFDGCMLIPKAPLKAKTEYRVFLEAIPENGEKIIKDWAFKTK